MTTYSGAEKAKNVRENLGDALAALQKDENLPEDVLEVAQYIAQAVGALFEAERASSEPDGKSSVKSALGSLSQTLALLQDVEGTNGGIKQATTAIAESMSALFPLTTASSMAPPPSDLRADSAPPAPDSVVEANIGATTESNFFVGFSGEIAEGGVFIATYNIHPKGTRLKVLITLPGGLSTEVHGNVRFIRDPMDFSSAESEPGMGVAFEKLPDTGRDLILRFIRKRPPMFYDD